MGIRCGSWPGWPPGGYWTTARLSSASVSPPTGGAKSPPADGCGRGLLLYDESMKRVYLADAQTEERLALRLMLLDLNLEVVGEAADWPTALDQAPATRPDMVVDWDLAANGSGSKHSGSSASSEGTSGEALADLGLACPTALGIVLSSHLDARQQAALSAGADAFISKSEMPDRGG